MCGVFGIIHNNRLNNQDLQSISNIIIKLSESRGKDASGIAVVTDKDIKIIKSPIRASNFIRTKKYNDLFTHDQKILAVVGHSRMETNGTFAVDYNNQPVVKEGIASVHNGIIVNDAKLWEEFPNLKREYQVDTEVFNSLLRNFISTKHNLKDAILETVKLLKGAYTIISLFSDLNHIAFLTNNGSLYELINPNNDIRIFASEKYFLEQVKIKFPKLFKEDDPIIQTSPYSCRLVNIDTDGEVCFTFNETTQDLFENKTKERQIQVESLKVNVVLPTTRSQNDKDFSDVQKIEEEEYQKNKEAIAKLRRCSKCLLPETMPFISFNEEGVCNYCESYNVPTPLGKDKFMEIAEQFRSTSRQADCIVPFSGGRDSSYGLHYLKKELGLNPVTYTYDWGMVTDLARRNIARMCGSLGIENILISADIQRKRENIRKNVTAWLKKPSLGTVPLFMAGDKQFFYYVNVVKRRTGIKMDVWMSNRLEETNFKIGYCGISPNFNKKRIDHLTLSQKIKLANFYSKQYLINPAYLNTSLLDTIGAYFSYYIEPRINYYSFFDYIQWDEEEINKTLIEQYDWETSPDTKSTWRIGDGTASFYNYIYYTMGGFTEIDTFRSNQIRNGQISRAKAYDLLLEESRPRLESIKWYCDTVGLHISEVIKIVNSQPKLYNPK